ncbi:ABC transporter permease [Cellulomonas sp. SLBN-39]|uniref:ABC transporter permease n=1 Tax=Cellulomonas sp. SLBN-39 TaxID=2768446 RepID=UPI00115411F6|nr:ABC transporter permease [Cellulomonas sp. SLBN-39]TQL03505.1 putative ABC transport system permease protein [Cellulomonas sp. SLBN-39]
MSGIVGAVVEAWDELRIHKLRVLLALIGVAAAVTAITGITAAVQMLEQGFVEQSERYNGRAVTVTVDAWPMTEQAGDASALDAEFTRTLERYDITWASRDLYTSVPYRFPGGTLAVSTRAVDVPLATMQRLDVPEGRWFTEADAEAFAPRLVVNEAFLDRLGVSGLTERPTVLLGREAPVRAAVVGVVPDQWEGADPEAFVLYDQLARWYGTEGDGSWGASAPSVRLWVPEEIVDTLVPRLQSDMATAMPGWDVQAYDNRDMSSGFLDDATRWVVLGVSGFALLLGGLGLVNISLVTVKHRIREIGIRRSFGATSSRVFFGVLMESVVATTVAGLVGVVIAVAVVKNIPVDAVFGGGIQDMPPFPLTAALVGMACATGVGAIAGLLPAVVAVRVKVIDAIRY